MAATLLLAALFLLKRADGGVHRMILKNTIRSVAIVVVVVLSTFPAICQNTIFKQPGVQNSVTGCLYQNGHRVVIPNVQIDWHTEPTSQSGGHSHLPDAARPRICLSTTGCTFYNETLTTYTNSLGCSTILAKQSWYAGEYTLYAIPTNPIYISDFVIYEVLITNLGPPFTSNAYTFSNSDNSNHPYNNFGNTVVLNDMLSAANQYYNWGRVQMLIFRVGNYQGGFLDSFSFWLPYPSVPEMHEDAQEFDAVVPSSTNYATNLRQYIQANHCTVTTFAISGINFHHAAFS